MNESSTQPIIELNNVDKFFGDFQALKNINLNVDVGEKVVVCGPSGSGKSTMIRCINHIESHDAGTITVDGIELTEDMNNVLTIRREVGMVFQQFNLFPHLTVLENLTLAPMKARRLSSKEADDIAMQYLERVQIPEQANKYPSQLSGGQQQRIFLARALAQDARIYMMDEPFAGVDATTEKAIVKLLEQMRSEKRTLLVVHHDLQTASEYFDHLLLLNRRLVAFGPTGEVFTEDLLRKTYGGHLTVLSQAGESIRQSKSGKK